MTLPLSSSSLLSFSLPGLLHPGQPARAPDLLLGARLAELLLEAIAPADGMVQRILVAVVRDPGLPALALPIHPHQVAHQVVLRAVDAGDVLEISVAHWPTPGRSSPGFSERGPRDPHTSAGAPPWTVSILRYARAPVPPPHCRWPASGSCGDPHLRMQTMAHGRI